METGSRLGDSQSLRLFLIHPLFMQHKPYTAEHPVILFDGVCNLCNSSVQFVIKHDPTGRFRFASLQSAAGQRLLQQYEHPGAKQFSSVVLVENNRLYTRSTAVLRIARRLTGAWPLLYSFIILPPFLRNAVYSYIAANRYRWYGKQDACWLPSPGLSERFL